MENYLDRDYAAVSDVLILYSGAGTENLHVPARLGGTEIRTVGKGAFSNLKNVCCVTVPQTIRTLGERAFYSSPHLQEVRFETLPDEIGPQAFRRCGNLKKITVNAFSLPLYEYRNLVDNSLCCGNVRVACRFPASDTLRKLADALDVRPAAEIPYAVPCLFVGNTENAAAFFGREPAPCFDFRTGKTAVAELDAFYDLMAGGSDLRLAEAEKKNDEFMKRDICFEVQKTLLFTFNESSARTRGGSVYFSACLLADRYYWQSGVSVCVGSGPCEIYMRNYLHTEQDIPYVRKETAILQNGRRITDRKELNCVYEKYELLTLL